MSDWIPLVAQIKSVIQYVAGDDEGAIQTQENFVKRCPGVSQTFSAYQALSGDPTGAKETQKEFVGMINDTVNSIPLVGHAKGVVHYVVGDKDGGDEAMKSASHTAGTIGGGIVGFGLLGPVGAVAGGIAGGAAMDITITTADSLIYEEQRPYGYVCQIKQIKNKPEDAGQWVDMATTIAFDGIAGHTAAVAYNQQTNKKSTKGKHKKQKSKNAKIGDGKSKSKRTNMKADYKIHKNSNTSDNGQGREHKLPIETVKKNEHAHGTKVMTPQRKTVTSVIADLTNSTTETALAVGQVVGTTKGILHNSSAGDILLHTLSRTGKEKSTNSNRKVTQENVTCPIPKETKVTDIAQLKRGDHVKYKRLFGYSHHAIVTSVWIKSEEYEVIHFAPAKAQHGNCAKSHIQREVKKLEDFLYLLEYEKSVRNQPEKTANIAEVMLEYSGQDCVDVYNVFNNNCEHLATYCATGNSYSTQVENAENLGKALVKLGKLAALRHSSRQNDETADD